MTDDWAYPEPNERPLSEDCRCITRVAGDGALIVIADSECDRHSPAIVDAR